MLRKTLKYDLNAVYKIWLILTVTVIGISVIGGLALRDLTIVDDQTVNIDAYSFFSAMGFMATIFSICAYIVFVKLLVLYRYYQNFFTDEAYLTFTLPVKRRTLFNSKLINAFIWSIANGAAVTICVVIILALTPMNSDGSGSMLVDTVKTIFNLIEQIFEYFDIWAFSYAIIIILITLLSTVFSTLLIYACITLGCTIVKKNKLLTAILVYYVTNSLISFLAYIATAICSLIIANSIELLEMYSEMQLKLIVFFVLLAIAMFVLTICIMAYKFSLSRIEKNLNLA